MKTFTALEAQALEFNSLYQDMIQALGADQETGSHHFNNLAADEFAKKFPSFHESLDKLGAAINAAMPEDY